MASRRVRGHDEGSLKFQLLSEQLRRDIRGGVWAPGTKIPTERALSSQTGFSLTTVRRALDELESGGLIDRRRGSGTFVARAQPTPTRRRLHVGVMIPDTQLYYGQVLAGVEAFMRTERVDLQLATSGYQPEQEDTAIQSLLDAGVDGLLIVPSRPDLSGTRRAAVLEPPAIPAGLPTVWMERRRGGSRPSDDISSVRSDHLGGAYDAVTYLHSLGHERISLLYRINPFTAVDVCEGYEVAMKDLDLPCDSVPVPKDAWTQDTCDGLIEHLRDVRSTAVLVFGDREATLVQNAARRRGLDIPQDLAMISYDDELADLASVPLTAVAPEKFRVGELAAQMLIRRMDLHGSEPVTQTFLRPHLVIRDSCGGDPPAAAPHPTHPRTTGTDHGPRKAR